MIQPARLISREGVIRWASCVFTAAFLLTLFAEWFWSETLNDLGNFTWWVLLASFGGSYRSLRFAIFDFDLIGVRLLSSMATVAWLMWPLVFRPSFRLAVVSSLLGWSPALLIYTGVARMSLESLSFLMPFTSYWITVLFMYVVRVQFEKRFTTFSGFLLGIAFVLILLASLPLAILGMYLLLVEWWKIPVISGLLLLVATYVHRRGRTGRSGKVRYLWSGILTLLIVLFAWAAIMLPIVFP